MSPRTLKIALGLAALSLVAVTAVAAIIASNTVLARVNIISAPPTLQVLGPGCNSTLTIIDFGSVVVGHSSFAFACLHNTGTAVLYIHPRDMNSTFPSTFGTLTWNVTSTSILKSGQNLPILLKLAVAPTASTFQVFFNITFTGENS